MNEVIASIYLTLAEILGPSEDVRSDSFLVLDSFLDDDGLGILLLVPFSVKSKGCAVKDSLFTISETVVCWIEFPVVLSLLLLTGCVVAVGFSVQCRSRWIISHECSSNRVEHLFSVLEALAWNTELGVFLDMIWPFVLATETLSKRLTAMRSVFILLDIVKFIG